MHGGGIMKINYHLKSPSGCGDEQRQTSKSKGLFIACACLLSGYWEREVLRECGWLEGTNYTDDIGECVTGIDIRIGNAEYNCTVDEDINDNFITFNVVVVNRTTSSKWHLKELARATRIIPQHCRVAFKAWECLT
jgi:hypothetical protein